MVAFTCSSCQKKLSVKDDLAGKKVKCPACGHVTVVPVQPASVNLSNDDQPTVALAPNLDVPTMPPKPADASHTATNPSLSNPDATQGVKNGPGHDASLTDFLAPPQADDELGRLGKYRILKILGHGGMGVVFLGEDPNLGRKVAIKAMLPHLAQSKSSQHRFLREARTAATLEHDHVVPIFQVDEDRGAPYIVMPLLKGEPLDERLKRAEPIPISEIMRIGREIAEGLDAAHALGLVHRDIKPANIWLEAPKNRVKILDFGLARQVAEDAGLTQQGAIIGTPAYMSPEQSRGENVDARCDLFSLGVVLYRMCTGQLPFQGRDTVSTLMAVAMKHPAAPSETNRELPEGLSDLVMKLLEKAPANRTSSAAEVVQAIQGMEAKRTSEMTGSGKTEDLQAGDPKHGITAVARSGDRATTKWGDPATTKIGGSALTQTPDLTVTTAALAGVPRRKSVSLFACALFAVFGVLLLGAGGVYYWQTNNGIVRIEINDPNIKVAFDKNGPTITGVDKHDIKLSPGEFGLTVERGDLKFDTDKFIVKRGETITLKIEWFKDGKLQVVDTGGKIVGATWVRMGDSPTNLPTNSVWALEFDGVSSYVKCESLPYAGNLPHTIEAWVRPKPSTEKVQRIVGQWGPKNIWLGMWEGAWEAGQANYEGPQLKYNCANGVANAPTDRLRHVAAVFHPGGNRIYVDGKLLASEQRGPGAIKAFQVPPMITMIGAENESGRFGFTGQIHGIRISRFARYDKDFVPANRFEKDNQTDALFLFDEGKGDILRDSSGNNHHCKIVGAKWVKAERTPIAPRAVYALQFDGGTKAVGPLPFEMDPTKPFTFEAYCIRAKSGHKGDGSWPYYAEFAGLSAQSNEWNFWLREKTDGYNPTHQIRAPAADVETHVAGVYTGKELLLFVNGKLITRKNVQDAIPKAQGKPVTLGTGYSGLLREARISKIARYDKDFTPAHRFEPDADTLALYHFDEGSGDVLKDSSGNGHHGKIVGAKWVKADGAPIAPPPATDYALVFTGKKREVSVPSLILDLSGPLTLEGYITQQGETGQQTALFAYNLINLRGGKTWSFNVFEPPAEAQSVIPVKPGKKTHVAGVFTGSQLRLFVDGELAVSKEVGNLSFSKGKQPFEMGWEFTGLIDEVRISKIARYDKNFTPAQRFEPDADTVALYHFDEGSGDVLKDSSGNAHHGKIAGARWVKADGTPIAPPAERALLFDGTGKVDVPTLKMDNHEQVTLEGYFDLKQQKSFRASLAIIGDGRIGLSFTSKGGVLNAQLPGMGGPLHLTVPKRRVHIALVLTPTEGTAFLDGVMVKQKQRGAGRPDGIWPFQIGWPEVEGTMSEIRVSKVARYDKNFTPAKRFDPDPDTLALYHCDEGAGDVLHDSSGNGHHGKIVGAKWVKAGGTLPANDDEFAAAAWVLSKKGEVTIRINGSDRVFEGKKAEPLPKGLFAVVGVHLGTSAAGPAETISDDDLRRLAPLTRLETLRLSRQPVTAAGLAHLVGCTDLKELRIFATGIQVDGIPVVARFPRLESIQPPGNERPNLPLFKTDIWAAAIAKMPNIRHLDVYRSDITAAGVAELAQAPKLESLNVNNCRTFDDACLKALRSCKTLRKLVLDEASAKEGKILTRAEMARLKEALPECQILVGDRATPFAVFPPLDPAWLKDVAGMTPGKQVKAVKEELAIRNPGFDASKVGYKAGDNGVVYELTMRTDKVTDISPLRALTGLRILRCNGSGKDRGQLADLWPLKDLKLTHFECNFTKVLDLAPLEGMKLIDLQCQGTKVTNLAPLKGMPLNTVRCDFNAERDGDILRSIPTLETINGQMAKELLK